MHVVKFVIFTIGFGLVWTTQAQTPPKVHLIWMGGSDCPPCVNWRRFELPKLEKMAEFQEVTFSYVAKTIKSPVPASFFLLFPHLPFSVFLLLASLPLGVLLLLAHLTGRVIAVVSSVCRGHKYCCVGVTKHSTEIRNSCRHQ